MSSGTGSVGKSVWYIQLQGVGQAVRGMKQMSRATADLGSITQSFLQIYAGNRMAQIAAGWAVYAARVETLGPVFHLVGRNAGYTSDQLVRQEGVLRKLGITTEHARQVTTRLIQAQLGLGNAARLARISQDAAVIAGVNSSETYAMMTRAIQMMYPRLLRTVGITITATRAYYDYANALGKSSAHLTVNERQQALLNAVLKEGTKITGTYERAMKTAGKQILSFPRYIAEMKNILGEKFLPILHTVVFGFRDFYKMFTDEKNESIRTLTASITAFVATTAGVLALAAAIRVLVVALRFLTFSSTPVGLAIGVLALGVGTLVALLVAEESQIQELVKSAGRKRWAETHKNTTLLLKEETIAVRSLVKEYEKMIQAVGRTTKPVSILADRIKDFQIRLPHLADDIKKAFGEGGMDGARRVITVVNNELSRQTQLLRDTSQFFAMLAEQYVRAAKHSQQWQTLTIIAMANAEKTVLSLQQAAQRRGMDQQLNLVESQPRKMDLINDATVRRIRLIEKLRAVQEKLRMQQLKEVQNADDIKQIEEELDGMRVAAYRKAARLIEGLREQETEWLDRLFRPLTQWIKDLYRMSAAQAGFESVLKRQREDLEKNAQAFSNTAAAMEKLNQKYKSYLGLDLKSKLLTESEAANKMRKDAEERLVLLEKSIEWVKKRMASHKKYATLANELMLFEMESAAKAFRDMLSGSVEDTRLSGEVFEKKLDRARRLARGGDLTELLVSYEQEEERLQNISKELDEYRRKIEQVNKAKAQYILAAKAGDIYKAWTAVVYLLQNKALPTAVQMLDKEAKEYESRKRLTEEAKKLNDYLKQQKAIEYRLASDILAHTERQIEAVQRRAESLQQFVRGESLRMLSMDQPAIADRERMYDNYIRTLREYTSTVDDVRRVVSLYGQAEVYANRAAKERLATLQQQRRDERQTYRDAVQRLNVRLEESRHLGSSRERRKEQQEVYKEYRRITQDYRQRRRELRRRIRDEKEAIRRQKELTDALQLEAKLLEKKYGKEGKRNAKSYLDNLITQRKEYERITDELREEVRLLEQRLELRSKPTKEEEARADKHLQKVQKDAAVEEGRAAKKKKEAAKEEKKAAPAVGPAGLAVRHRKPRGMAAGLVRRGAARGVSRPAGRPPVGLAPDEKRRWINERAKAEMDRRRAVAAKRRRARAEQRQGRQNWLRARRQRALAARFASVDWESLVAKIGRGDIHPSKLKNLPPVLRKEIKKVLRAKKGVAEVGEARRGETKAEQEKKRLMQEWNRTHPGQGWPGTRRAGEVLRREASARGPAAKTPETDKRDRPIPKKPPARKHGRKPTGRWAKPGEEPERGLLPDDVILREATAEEVRGPKITTAADRARARGVRAAEEKLYKEPKEVTAAKEEAIGRSTVEAWAAVDALKRKVSDNKEDVKATYDELQDGLNEVSQTYQQLKIDLAEISAENEAELKSLTEQLKQAEEQEHQREIDRIKRRIHERAVSEVVQEQYIQELSDEIQKLKDKIRKNKQPAGAQIPEGAVVPPRIALPPVADAIKQNTGQLERGQKDIQIGLDLFASADQERAQVMLTSLDTLGSWLGDMVDNVGDVKDGLEAEMAALRQSVKARIDALAASIKAIGIIARG